MADLLPSIPDASVSEEAEPRVVGLDDDDAEDVLGALSSTTARQLFAELNEEPAHPSALADRVETSLQNVQYHLSKLQDAGMVEVVDTAYSAKGREMDVYAPADRPLVVFAGDDEDQSLLNQALGRLLGGLGIVAGASLAVRGLASSEGTQTPVETGPESLGSGAAVGDGGAGGGDAGAPPAEDGGDVDVTADGGMDTGGTDGGGMDATTGGDGVDGDAAQDVPAEGAEYTDVDLETTTPSSLQERGEYSLAENASQLDVDVSGTGDAVAGAGEPVASVEPATHELSWIVEPLAATGLPPSIAVAVLGGSLLAGGLLAWVWRKRQMRV